MVRIVDNSCFGLQEAAKARSVWSPARYRTAQSLQAPPTSPTLEPRMEGM